MNEADQNSPEDIERLLRATAPPDVTATNLEAETLALRDGLLRLGDLLDRAAGEFDEAALLAKLQAEMPEVKKERPWILPASIFGGVVVAAILLLLCQTFFNFEIDPNAGTTAVGPTQKNPPAENPSFELPLIPWRDVIDDRLTIAQLKMQEASYLPMRGSSLNSVTEEIRAAQHELNTSSL